MISTFFSWNKFFNFFASWTK